MYITQLKTSKDFSSSSLCKLGEWLSDWINYYTFQWNRSNG